MPESYLSNLNRCKIFGAKLVSLPSIHWGQTMDERLFCTEDAPLPQRSADFASRGRTSERRNHIRQKVFLSVEQTRHLRTLTRKCRSWQVVSSSINVGVIRQSLKRLFDMPWKLNARFFGRV